MRQILATLSILFAALLPVRAPAQAAAATPAEAADPQAFTTDDRAVGTVTDYLARMKVSCQRNAEFKYPVLDFATTLTNATHQVRIVIDTKHAVVYIFLNRYLMVPDASPNRDAFLRGLMKKNWDLNIGKFEWDPSDGEVRYSYSFSTENGVGFEAFRAVVATLLASGDKLLPELKHLAETGQPAETK